MNDLVRLLAVLGRINPAIWDAIIPHGPRYRRAIGRRSPGERVGLNPQPLPPREELMFASARVAHDIASAAVAAEAAGTDAAGRIVSRAVDEWCGTPPGHLPIPWPGPWPFPWPPPPEPHPDWDVGAARVVGALCFASVAARLPEGETRELLSRGAEQLFEAGTG